MRYLLLVLTLILPAMPVVAQSGATAPRTGPIAVVEVAVPTPDALDALSRGFVVDDYRAGVATVYADAADLARLRAQGYTYTVVPPEPEPPKALGAYHTYASLTTELQAYAQAHPDIARLVSLGESTNGRELWAMEISDNPGADEDEPEFKYIGSMHGDEPVGGELLLYLIDLLLNGYQSDSRIRNLVDETDIWIVPVMNPDGLEARTRFNGQGEDLNRTFPGYPFDYTGTWYDGTPLNAEDRPTEVRLVMEWTVANSFTLSANFHSGALLVNYPYDYDGGPAGVPAISPDDELFREISLRYSEHNPPMYSNPLDPDSPEAPDGITNGAAWYTVIGSMQDWNYRYAGVNEVTIELSNTKRPAASALPQLWENNRESMLAYLESVHLGVRGVVTDGADPIYARVQVVGNAHPVYTDPDIGDYHRMLLPGTYTLLFTAPGFLPKTYSHVAVTGNGPTTRADVVLVAARNDIDGDGRMTAVDVQLVVNGALGLPAPPAADVDGGGITASDVQTVINALLMS